MPRGKYTNHKGKHRRFTNPEEIEEQMKREEKERKWREERGDASSSEDEDGAGASKKADKSGSSSDSSSEEESSEEEAKAKGVGSLIEVENPNRIQKKVKKLTTLNEAVKSAPGKPELSRKEREELERQRAHANYQKMHAEGKTDEARADLARLAIIKQQRAEAATRREEEQKKKEDAKQTKTAQTQKALGKKAT